MYSRTVNRFSATKAGSWLVKNVASRIDPFIFTATKGRFTLTGKPTLPQLTLFTVGRKSGEERKVQLAYQRDGGDYLVVASAMGQERHPAWKYNLEAAPEATVQLRGERLEVKATALTDAEKKAVWPAIKQAIPQMNVYEERTDRNITVFRLTPTGPA
jgi:deazaflavin-dependent oxidoreductase (nitroreductase family)